MEHSDEDADELELESESDSWEEPDNLSPSMPIKQEVSEDEQAMVVLPKRGRPTKKEAAAARANGTSVRENRGLKAKTKLRARLDLSSYSQLSIA